MDEKIPPTTIARADNDGSAGVAPEPTTLRGSETVLVVDDEPRLVAVVTKILREYGYTVLQAQTLTDAIAICEQYPGKIDLLVADIMLAKATGPQLASRVVVKRPEMKVLYMSGHAANSMLTSAVIASGARFMQKPIVPDVLLRQVRSVLGSSPQPALT
jgi:two-component system cell cycle sensor histidine kinase/response regulator CckA